MTRAYYASILNIPPDADAALIKAAYRQLAKKFHPDINPDPSARERFLELKKAYDFLLSTPYQSQTVYTESAAQQREEEFKKRREQRMRYAREMRQKKEQQEKEAWEKFQQSPMKWALVFITLTTYFVIMTICIQNIFQYPNNVQAPNADPESALLGCIVVVAVFTAAMYRFYLFIRK